jgi:hypothetical protein
VSLARWSWSASHAAKVLPGAAPPHLVDPSYERVGECFVVTDLGTTRLAVDDELTLCTWVRLDRGNGSYGWARAGIVVIGHPPTLSNPFARGSVARYDTVPDG